MTNKTNWNFNEDLPNGLEEATRNAFKPIWHSAALNMGNEHNWRNLNDGWFSGLKIGEASSIDQFGSPQTWELQLNESGGIMQSAENTSRWQLRIAGK